MEMRVNLAIAGVLTAMWAGLTASDPVAALDPADAQTDRLSELEDAFAHERSDPQLVRRLATTYLELDRPQHALVALRAVDPELLDRPLVAHRLAQAYEASGRVDDALATAELALDRCARAIGTADAPKGTPVPEVGCDVHTHATLRIHHRALSHMARVGITDPRNDRRTRLAYDVAMRRARIASAQ